MKKQNNSQKMGFSLIELSIVILIIGILVLGITKGAAIMTKTRVSSAKSLTSGSPVAIISDLVTWYEPVMDSSFNPANVFDGTALTNVNGAAWYDNSPNKTLHASIGTSAPTYRDSSINSLPALRFDGTDDTLTFNCSLMNGKDYTIFVVEQKRNTTAVQRFLTLGDTASTNSFGYTTNTTVGGTTAAHTVTVSGLTANTGPYTPRIITLLSDSNNAVPTTARKAFSNGTAGTGVDATTKITVTGSTCLIGANATAATPTNPYNGDIAEIIIYSRALKADERNDIQSYLSKKYGIKVAISS